MSIESQGHFFTIYFPGFVCFVLYKAKISGERLQDHWSSGFQCHSTSKYSNFDQNFVSALYLLNRMMDSGQDLYIVTLDFSDLDQIFKKVKCIKSQIFEGFADYKKLLLV